MSEHGGTRRQFRGPRFGDRGSGANALTAGYVYDALTPSAIEENGTTSGPGLLADFTYDPLGRLTGKTTAGGAGLSTAWAYGDDGLLSSLTQTLIRHVRVSSPTLEAWPSRRDPASSLAEVVENDAATVRLGCAHPPMRQAWAA